MTTDVHPSFPGAGAAVRGLVHEHLKLTDEPLLLAVYYAPHREEHDIFLFEIIAGFGADQVADDREIFEVTYSDRKNFPLDPGQNLHLVLTNLPEFQKAVRENWPAIVELRDAIAANRYEIAYESAEGRKLAEMLK